MVARLVARVASSPRTYEKSGESTLAHVDVDVARQRRPALAGFAPKGQPVTLVILDGEFLLTPGSWSEGIDDPNVRVGFQPGIESGEIIGLDVERDGRAGAESFSDRLVVLVAVEVSRRFDHQVSVAAR